MSPIQLRETKAFSHHQAESSFAEATLQELVHASPLRQTAACPYFGVCGGCQLQHVSYETQLEAKRQAVVDALKRIGKVTEDIQITIVPAVQQWAYRRHITLTLQANTEGWSAGFVAMDQSRLVPIHCCPIFTEQQAPFDLIRQFLGKLASLPEHRGRLTVIKQAENQWVLLFQFERLPAILKM